MNTFNGDFLELYAVEIINVSINRYIDKNQSKTIALENYCGHFRN